MLEGYIEGYYGRLFSKQERELLLDHMGRLKMDFYIYGPKEDPYHRVMWEKLYPKKEREVLIDFVKHSRKKGIKPVFALSPGLKLIQFGDFKKKITAKLNQAKKIGFKSNVFFAAKLYPANATTNSSHGVRKIKNLYKIFELMQDSGMPLLIHGEVTDSEVDVFDREEVFIDKELSQITKRFPKLKIVLEHITTSYAVDFVQENNIGATITPHHLHINRNAMFFGGLNSDFYCLPVAKREKNRIALRKAATSGKECFFLGTDSAPHLRKWKAFCGCAGIFNSPVAIQSYLTVFEEENALDNFEKFASLNGPNFYNVPPNKEKLKLVSRPNKIKEFIDVVEEKNIVGQIKPFHAGETLQWQVEGIVN